MLKGLVRFALEIPRRPKNPSTPRRKRVMQSKPQKPSRRKLRPIGLRPMPTLPKSAPRHDAEIAAQLSAHTIELQKRTQTTMPRARAHRAREGSRRRARQAQSRARGSETAARSCAQARRRQAAERSFWRRRPLPSGRAAALFRRRHPVKTQKLDTARGRNRPAKTQKQLHHWTPPNDTLRRPPLTHWVAQRGKPLLGPLARKS